MVLKFTPIKTLVAKPTLQSIRQRNLDLRNLSLRWAAWLGNIPCDLMASCEIQSNGRCQRCG